MTYMERHFTFFSNINTSLTASASLEASSRILWHINQLFPLHGANNFCISSVVLETSGRYTKPDENPFTHKK